MLDADTQQPGHTEPDDTIDFDDRFDDSFIFSFAILQAYRVTPGKLIEMQ